MIKIVFFTGDGFFIKALPKTGMNSFGFNCFKNRDKFIVIIILLLHQNIETLH